MTFQNAVEQTPPIQEAYRPGLRALKRKDRACVQVADQRTTQLRGSIDLDQALQSRYPNDARWDYGVAVLHSSDPEEKIYWIEVHSARPGDIDLVRQKYQWLKTWLANEGALLGQFRAEYIWVSSGKTAFARGIKTASSPKLRKLAIEGVRHVGQRLNIGGRDPRQRGRCEASPVLRLCPQALQPHAQIPTRGCA